MEPFDDECRARIRRHRDQRKTIGFETVECYTNLAGADIPPGACVLLEDLSNLLANEMFAPEGGGVDAVRRGLLSLMERCRNLTVVSNEIFSGGTAYEGETLAYMQNLALLIWGANDTATPLWMGQRMEKEIGDAALIVFENCGHFAYLEQYARFMAIVRQFLGA